MKKLIVPLFLCISCLAICTNAQDKPQENRPLTQLLGFEDVKIGGSTTIRIPSVEGFIHAVPTSNPLTASFKRRIAGNDDILAIYLSNDDWKMVETGQRRVLNFYAQFSTSVRYEETGAPAVEFDQLAFSLTKGADQVFDANGGLIPSARDKVRTQLDQGANGAASGPKFEPTKLGMFNNDKVMFSLLWSQSEIVKGEKITYIFTGSSLYLKNRVLFLHIYRLYHSDADIDVLGTLTKKWTAAIIAANK